MKAIKFQQANVNVAENQPEYDTLPSFGGVVGNTPQETGIICCFELDEEEVTNVVAHRKLWYRSLTFGNRIQPFNIFAVRDYFDFDASYPDAKHFKEVDNVYNDTTFKLTFWQRLRLIFGAKMVIVYEIKSKGFISETPTVTVQSKYTWKQ